MPQKINYRRLEVLTFASETWRSNGIVAMAHHLARLVYRMLRYGEKYVEKGFERYEQKLRLQRIKCLKKTVAHLQLVLDQ
jgi:hypothetical protein